LADSEPAQSVAGFVDNWTSTGLQLAIDCWIQAPAGHMKLSIEPASRDELVRVVIDTTGSSEDIARRIMALYFDPDRGVVPKQGEIDVKGFAQVIQLMAEAGELAPPLLVRSALSTCST